MPLTKEQLAYFKKRLLDEKDRLTKDIEDLGKKDANGNFKVNNQDAIGNSDDDTAEKLTEYGDSLALESRLDAELRDVIKALEAIEKGTYGICKYTGKEIDIRRLEARPTSLTSIEAKKTLTQEL